MKHFSMVIAALLGLAFSLAAAASDTIETATANYTITDLEWVVPISPDRNVTVTGTVEDVIRHLQALAPERVAALDMSSTDFPGSSVDAALGQALKPIKTICNVTKKKARSISIQVGIYDLKSVQGMPKNGPGPGSCGRVSCSYNSAIWWCNDNPYTLFLTSFKDIANGAEAALNECMGYHELSANGQSFFDGGWNVMVVGDDC